MADTKAEQKFDKSEFEKAVAEVLAKAVSDGIVAAAAVNEASRRQAAPPVKSFERCSECRQFKDACKGEHAKVVLQPTQPAPKDFPNPGYTLNGVHYQPRGRSPITLPKAAAEEAKSAIERWAAKAWEIKEGKSRQDILSWDGSSFETELRDERY